MATCLDSVEEEELSGSTESESDSSSDESLCEELVEEEGLQEMILTPRRVVSITASYKPAEDKVMD